ncbi:MAG: GNAT family N-acetyltransferase [Terracoccus sp.]
MEIISLDRDDDVMIKAVFGVITRSEIASRVRPIERTLEEYTSMIRFQFPGEHDESAVAVVDGSPVGLAQVFFPDRDNLEKCWFDLEVDPQHRGRGVGSALLEWLEERGRAGGRSMVLGEVCVPVGERQSHPDREFALRRGYAVSSVEIVRSLPLPVDPALLERERQRVAAKTDGYDLSVHVGGVPNELRQGVCDCANRLILDAPTGDVEFEPESQTVDDYQTMLGHLAELSRTLVTTVAVHRESGVVAAYTDLALPANDSNIVFQWGTLVLPEHRGHRLGMAVKVENLAALSRIDSARTSVQTMNDEQNPWMVQINQRLGFAIIEEALSVRKDL